VGGEYEKGGKGRRESERRVKGGGGGEVRRKCWREEGTACEGVGGGGVRKGGEYKGNTRRGPTTHMNMYEPVRTHPNPCKHI
jgi:hypothetical protein